MTANISTRGRVLGIAYNVIPTADMERAAEWWTENFGFNARHHQEDSVSLFRDDRPILHLLQSDDMSRAHFRVEGRKRWIITFFTDDIEFLHKRLLAKGVLVSEISYEGHNGNFFTMEDLDGNLFDVWEHREVELVY